MLSISERDFIIESIKSNARIDGRTRLELRDVYLEYGLLSGTNGSAKATVSDEGTSVLVAVKLQLVENSHDKREDDEDNRLESELFKAKLQCFVDIWGTARYQLKNHEKDSIKSEISQFIENLYNETTLLDQHRLILVPGKLHWIVNLDISILNYGGSLLDLCLLAARTALWDTRIPKVSLETLNDGMYEYSVDELMEEELMIVESLPICVTLHKIGMEFYSADCTLEEEKCSEGSVTVAVNKYGNIYSLKKSNYGGIQPALLTEMILNAKKIGLDTIVKHDYFLLSKK